MLHPQARASLQAPPGGGEVEEIALDDPRFDPDVERRADRAAALAVTDRIDVDVVRNLDADGVPVRLYRPLEGARAALYVHGGGWVFHDLDTHDAFCRYLATRSGHALLAVDYRRAPEHPYPAPLDDVQTAARWLRANDRALGVDASFGVGIGDSAGANLVAGLCIRDRQALDLQVLLYPPTDPSGDSASMREEGDGLTASDMRWFWHAYAPDAPARRNPEVAPLLAPDLSGQPAALVITAEHDVLRDEGEAYAARLAETGVRVTATRYLGMLHGFWRHPEEFDAARSAVTQVAGALAQAAVEH